MTHRARQPFAPLKDFDPLESRLAEAGESCSPLVASATVSILEDSIDEPVVGDAVAQPASRPDGQG